MILAILAGIYIFFKPLEIKQQKFVDVPLFELQNFTLYELDTKGLHTIMLGSAAIRYSDRYRVENMDYTDSSKGYIANMCADKSIYKDDFVTLSGHVKYTRDDGLSFQTQKATYDKNSSIVESKVGYEAYFNESTIKGSYIRYNNAKNRIFSKNVQAKIQLQESK